MACPCGGTLQDARLTHQKDAVVMLYQRCRGCGREGNQRLVVLGQYTDLRDDAALAEFIRMKDRT